LTKSRFEISVPAKTSKRTAHTDLKTAASQRVKNRGAAMLKAAAKAVAAMGLATKKDPECVRVVVRSHHKRVGNTATACLPSMPALLHASRVRACDAPVMPICCVTPPAATRWPRRAPATALT